MFDKTARVTCYTEAALIGTAGVLVALSQALSFISAGAVLSVTLSLLALNSLVPQFTSEQSPEKPRWFLPCGAASGAFAIAFIFGLAPGYVPINVALGAMFCVFGAARALSSFQLKDAGSSQWMIMLFCGAMRVMAGVVMICATFESIELRTVVCGLIAALSAGLPVLEAHRVYASRETTPKSKEPKKKEPKKKGADV